jgi:hypothetical protein
MEMQAKVEHRKRAQILDSNFIMRISQITKHEK